MKVLFAVSSENISDAIIKRYQKEYKEILSYKNVYYFNAILKEIQKDKTYDRIVISEDLEPFSNNNYETIDKFLFEKLDSISDEAQDSSGKETSIILICSDRRQKGNSILVKLFGIGVYNALLGNDRSMEEVCKLISRPRTKKEAKIYYRIDSDDVSYKAENENEVSEVEIQNILAHFKKLGKNTAKYTDSFNNIAVQYNDEQLKIIVNCLPINVKAVLEANCERYQELMKSIKGIRSVKHMMTSTEDIEGAVKKEFSSKNVGQAGNITKPIVIPSAVRNVKNQAQVAKKTVQQPTTTTIQPVVNATAQEKTVQDEIVEKPQVQERITGTVFQRPRRPIPGMSRTMPNAVQQPQATPQPQIPTEPIEENDELLPGFEADEIIEETEAITAKRGRGRPRKTPVEGAVIKPKGKRGRPRKLQEEDITLEEEDVILPGIEEEEVEEYIDEEATMLPGMGFEDEEVIEDEEVTDNENIIYEEDYTDEVSLPGLDGLDDLDDINTDNLDNEEDSELLPGFEEVEEETDLIQENIDNNVIEEVAPVEEELLPGFEEEDDLLPGIGKFEDEQPEISSNMNSNSNTVESIKPRVDYSMSSLNSLITKDKKIVTFIGTGKNGVSFLVNNLAALFSSLGINTAVLDMTQNKNSYYIYTKNEDELRNIAFNSIEKLQNGYAEGIKVDKNLTVYTALPNDGKDYSNAEPILSTLVQNHSLVLIDCDYNTDLTYFASCQEMYLVQSMDILTIQPLTAFLRELKTRGILEPEKIRVVINKELKVKSLSIKAIIGGISYYNDPAMSFMTELFNKDMVKACTIPFEDNAYSKYLEGIVNCNISLNGFSKAFLSKLKVLGDMVYPLTSKQTYGKGTQIPNNNQNAFSSSMNDTLNKMRKKY